MTVSYLLRFFDGNELSFLERWGGLYFFWRKSREMSFCLLVVFCPAMNLCTLFTYVHYTTSIPKDNEAAVKHELQERSEL